MQNLVMLFIISFIIWILWVIGFPLYLKIKKKICNRL